MVVDDNAIVGRHIRELLREEGFRVAVFERPWDALASARAPLPPSLLVTDISMPEMDGLELAARLLSVWPRLAVICTSGYSHRATAIPQLLPAETVFLRKPFAQAQFAAAVETALRDRNHSGANHRHTSTG